jgi:hypothetical protein
VCVCFYESVCVCVCMCVCTMMLLRQGLKQLFSRQQGGCCSLPLQLAQLPPVCVCVCVCSCVRMCVCVCVCVISGSLGPGPQRNYYSRVQ